MSQGGDFKKWMIVVLFAPLIPLLSQYGINSREIRKVKDMTYKQVIEYIDTEKKADWYITKCIGLKASPDFVKSFKKTHKDGVGDCADVAVAVAALLGYEPKCLDMIEMPRQFYKGDILSDRIFYFEKNRKYYTISRKGSDGIPFSRLEDIVKFLGFDAYRCTYLDPLQTPDWIHTEKNLRLSFKPKSDYIMVD